MTPDVSGKSLRDLPLTRGTSCQAVSQRRGKTDLTAILRIPQTEGDNTKEVVPESIGIVVMGPKTTSSQGYQTIYEYWGW